MEKEKKGGIFSGLFIFIFIILLLVGSFLLIKYLLLSGKIYKDSGCDSYELSHNKEVVEVNGLNQIIKDSNPLSDKSIDFTRSSEDVTTSGLFVIDSSINDSYPIYYYRGVVNNNYVKLGSYCFRIVRTTDVGSIRLIYSGLSSDNTCNVLDTTIGNSPYNMSYRGEKYINYNDSMIKDYIDKWYIENIDIYKDYLNEDINFCNDTNVMSWFGYLDSMSTKDENSLLDENKKIEKNTREKVDESYMDYIIPNYIQRILDGDDKYYCTSYRIYKGIPTTGCDKKYSININNGKLRYPIGLLSVEEAILAGGGTIKSSRGNSTYYLYNGGNYWLLGSDGFNGSSKMYAINGSKSLNETYTLDQEFGVRPVIELKVNTLVQMGDGTIDNPFVIV